MAHLGHLEVLELLLPGEDRLQAANPHVDVADQHGLADASEERAQRGAQILQEAFDEARVLLVVENLLNDFIQNVEVILLCHTTQ